MKIAVFGASGRMGLCILRTIAKEPGLEAVAALTGASDPAIGQDAMTLAGVARPDRGPVISANLAELDPADVIIDFSTPAGTATLLERCESTPKPLVVGTTGLDARAQAAIDALARTTPCVVAPNYSQGVTLLFHLAARAAELLGPSFDAEIIEMHHRHKVDAPSGTALRLYEAVAEAKSFDKETAGIHGRSGQVGARSPSEIGVMTLRGGDVVGEHTLLLAGEGERVELSHRATDRHIFARGAVRAAQWVASQEPGRYDMNDVMGIDRR